MASLTIDQQKAIALASARARAAEADNKPSSIVDAARSIPGGLAQGVAGTIGLPSTALNFISNKVGGLVGREEIPDADPRATTFMGIPTAGQANAAISKPTGGYYKPQTTAGRYAETAASFAPAIFGGEAGLGARLLGRVLAPAAGSQLAGSAVDANTSPTLHSAAQIGGALLGGGLAGGARALGGALLKDVPADVAAQKQLATFAGNMGATPETIARNTIPGRGQLGAEALGPNGVAMLATLGRRSGATGEALGNHLVARSVNAPARMMDDFTSAAGIDPRAAQGNFDQVLEAGQKRAAPLYDEAYKQNTNMASPVLDKILETPAGKKALADARTKMQNDMSLMGTPDADLMEQAREGGTELPAKGAASGMKLRVYDYVKRSLDDQISSAFRAGNKNEGSILVDLKGKLVKALDDSDVTGQAGPNSVKPEGGAYARARSAAGDYLGAKQAYEDGQSHILSTSTSADDVAKYVAKLSPTALEAYKGGIANKILTQAQNSRLTPRLVGTDAVRLKLAAAIGPEKAQQFIDNIQNEASLAASGNRMKPGTGSISSDVLMNADEMDHGANIQAGMHGAHALGHALQGNVVGATTRGLAAVRHFAPDILRSGGMNADTRNELGRMLMLPPEDLAEQIKAFPKQAPKNTSAIGRFLIGNR